MRECYLLSPKSTLGDTSVGGSSVIWSNAFDSSRDVTGMAACISARCSYIAYILWRAAVFCINGQYTLLTSSGLDQWCHTIIKGTLPDGHQRSAWLVRTFANVETCTLVQCLCNTGSQDNWRIKTFIRT